MELLQEPWPRIVRDTVALMLSVDCLAIGRVQAEMWCTCLSGYSTLCLIMQVVLGGVCE